MTAQWIVLPNSMSDHLYATGWTMVASVRGKWEMWKMSLADGQDFEILLPLDDGYRDYKIRMAEAMATLDAAEKMRALRS